MDCMMVVIELFIRDCRRRRPATVSVVGNEFDGKIVNPRCIYKSVSLGKLSGPSCLAIS